MEERLDDAINVLRSHCEPQINMSGGMEATIGNQFANVPTQPQSADAPGLSQPPLSQDSVALPIDLPVKVERPSVPSVSSEYCVQRNDFYCILMTLKMIIIVFYFNRKKKGTARLRYKAKQQFGGWCCLK
jgi:hypothetical protein